MNKFELRQIIREVVYRKIVEANLDSIESDPTDTPISPSLQKDIDTTKEEIESTKEEVTALKGKIAKLREPILRAEQRAEKDISAKEKKLGVLTKKLETLTKKAGGSKKVPIKPPVMPDAQKI
jgi:septal ring factor EnvC (AmiA/AmiB activator)